MKRIGLTLIVILLLAPAAFAADGPGNQNDWGTGGTGTYGTCTTDHACSLTYGGCWFKVYAKCQDKTAGEGDVCKAC